MGEVKSVAMTIVRRSANATQLFEDLQNSRMVMLLLCYYLAVSARFAVSLVH